MLDYGFLKQIRLAAIVSYFAGLFLHIGTLQSIAFLVYLLTYMYTYGIMESAFFKMVEKATEKQDGEEENKDEKN